MSNSSSARGREGTQRGRARDRPRDVKQRSGHVVSGYVLLPGVYAWVTTVALPAFDSRGNLAARAAALLGPVALLAGTLIARRHARWGRRVGIWGFLGTSTLCWLLLGSALAVADLEPVRAALGSLGWALFALGWGSVRDVGHVPEQDPRAIGGQNLKARGHIPPLRVAIFALSVIAAVVPLLLAWRIARAEQALLGHVVALLAAIATVSVGARIAVERTEYKPVEPPLARLAAASGPLTLLALLVALGLLFSVL